MESFSKRQGIEPEKAIQLESMDDRLRNGLWNAVSGLVNQAVKPARGTVYYRPVPRDSLKAVIGDLWREHLGRPLDTMPSKWDECWESIRSVYFSYDWNEVYAFLQFIAERADNITNNGKAEFIRGCNEVMERERSGYRFVGDRIVPITNEVEIAEVEQALSMPHDAVRKQVQSALEKFADREKPDCRNCIKESISAVETVVKLIDGRPDATLSSAIGKLKKKIDLNDNLEQGWKKLYDYTSDEKAGIRHGAMDKSDLTSDDARYWLVSCSAFANYLLRLADKAGIDLKS